MKRLPLVSTILLLLYFSAHAQTASPDDGVVKNGVYASLVFSFGFTYPTGWVVHDEAIDERIRKRIKEEASKSGELSQLKNTYLLFTVSRYPRGKQSTALNPTVLVFAEKIAHGRGNPNGKDYLLSLRPIKLKGGAQPLLNEPVEFRVAGFQFFRDDYSGEVNGVYVRKAYFVNVRKGYALIFSFTGHDQKNVEEMAESMKTILPLGTGGGLRTRSTSEGKPN